MIGRLTGVVVEHAPDGSCVLDVSGVGYEVFVPQRALARSNGTAPLTLHVHTHVREDALTLYGFANADDRTAFRMLMGVSGVGPKLAMTVLSELSAAELSRVVARSERGRLEAISGVGKKTAARLLLELKDKLIGGAPASPAADFAQAVAAFEPGDPASQACDALTGLGFSRAQAEAAVAKARRSDVSASVEQLLRQALATLG